MWICPVPSSEAGQEQLNGRKSYWIDYQDYTKSLRMQKCLRMVSDNFNLGIKTRSIFLRGLLVSFTIEIPASQYFCASISIYIISC